MAKVWTSRSNLNIGRRAHTGFGSISATLAVAGFTGGYEESVEEWDGSSWSFVADVNTPRYGLAGCGTVSAGLCFGGYNITNATEAYDGSAWSAGGDLINGRYYLAGCGTQVAALSICGRIGDEGSYYCEEYNGTTWSSVADLTPVKCFLGGFGTLTAGLAFGGFDYAHGESHITSHKYNGTSWSSGGDLNTARRSTAGAGVQTSGLAVGGYDTARLSSAEEYNGTSWTTDAAILNSAVSGPAASGSLTDSILIFGGKTDVEDYTGDTEEFAEPPPFYPIDVQDSAAVAEYLALLREVYGSITCGHVTDVEEDNVFKLSDFLTGTGSIAGTGDSEKLTLSDGQEMVSETFELGEGDCKIDQNKYGTGGEGTLYYRTAATRTACDAAGWTTYTGTFTSLGFVGFKVTM